MEATGQVQNWNKYYFLGESPLWGDSPIDLKVYENPLKQK
jgi:hypothetical protein